MEHISNPGVRCQWQRFEPAGRWPVFQCARCRVAVEIRSSDVQAALEALPDCGVTAGLLNARPPLLPPEQPASLPRRVGRYFSAVARWIAAGRPERDDAEVQRICDTLCRPCEPHFDPETESCRRCGCKVNGSKVALLNKIRMATEHCPLEKW